MIAAAISSLNVQMKRRRTKLKETNNNINKLTHDPPIVLWLAKNTSYT